MEKGCTFAPAFDRKRRVRQMRGSARTLKSMKQEIACVRLQCKEHMEAGCESQGYREKFLQ